MITLDEKEIIEIIREAGVVGAGGAGFPTFQKFLGAADTIIINGAECEPLIQVDQGIMNTKAQELVNALKLLTKVKEARGIFALKEKYHAALVALEKAIVETDLTIHLLKNYYPVGDEHVLVYETTGRLVPEGGIPLQVKTIVINVETLLNIAKALADTPVIEKHITVIGEVDHPGTYIVPIGMDYEEIIAKARPKISEYKMIEGGPMMGKIVEGGVVTKTTKALLVLPEHHKLITKKTVLAASLKRMMGGCCQCHECTDFCPRYLLGHNLRPHMQMRAISFSLADQQWLAQAKSCSACGLCEYYVCPSGLSPKLVNQKIKAHLNQHNLKLNHTLGKSEVRQLRQFRQVSADRLISRLGLTKYNHPVPFGNKIIANQVKIILKQSVGSPATPIVNTGDWVEKGQRIATLPGGKLGTYLHASIAGVIKVKKDAIMIHSK